jgi:hypothetical protein
MAVGVPKNLTPNPFPSGKGNQIKRAGRGTRTNNAFTHVKREPECWAGRELLFRLGRGALCHQCGHGGEAFVADCYEKALGFCGQDAVG